MTEIKNRFSQNTALIIIDVQKGFDDPVWGKRNNPEAESNIAALLEAWRKSGRPIIHVRHNSLNTNSPLHPDSPGNAIKEVVKPGTSEQVIA
ncbi:MAG: isochorismatase family protein, partial [Candidatus Marinimicrobia bacterium]|nr:isochorismatase family protein [Candidatus Neomarinimicrobiota bacterium]